MEPPAILAHRGGALEAPENTLGAIAHARAVGADGIELDVRLSGDGEPVVFHDADLRRISGSHRVVRESGVHDLKKIRISKEDGRFGDQRIPTLAQALDAARGLAPIQLELKPEDDPHELAKSVVREVVTAGLASVVEITSFSRIVVDAVRASSRDIRTGLVLSEPVDESAWKDLALVSLSKELARGPLVEQAKARGLIVHVWTENDPSSLRRWTAAGVDGLITDRPALFVEARRALVRA